MAHLWGALCRAFDTLGFADAAGGDEVFRQLVLARIIEPTSKADSIRVLAELGIAAPSLRTIFRALGRCIERDYRDTLATACLAYSASTAAGKAALVLYDCTTLYFETDTEDQLRKVGMSKERRVDPQIQVGLLVDPGGFPLEVHCFEGNTAETTTLIPVLNAFQQRHGSPTWSWSPMPGCFRPATSTRSKTPSSPSSSARGSARPRTTWPSTLNGTATTSLTGRSSNRRA
jgi:hypothetical protein